MNAISPAHSISSGIDAQRLLVLSNFLKKSSAEFESTVLGGSMGKALPPGSIIRVRFANDANLETGQVVTYVATDRIVAHRLVKMATSRGGRYVITCGDGTVCPDAPMPVSAVIGILTEIRSNGVWRPVPPMQPRSFGFRLMAYLFSRIVLIALWLDPRFSNWVTARIVETRAMAVRGVEFVRHCARRNSSRPPVPRP